MELLESFERMTLSSKYRKYDRPDGTVKGNAKKWWVEVLAYMLIIKLHI